MSDVWIGSCGSRVIIIISEKMWLKNMNTTNLSQQGSIKPRFGSELDISVLPIGKAN